MMHVFMRGQADRLEQAALDIAREQKVWLFNGLAPSQIPAYCKFELTVGDGALEFSREEMVKLFKELIERLAESCSAKAQPPPRGQAVENDAWAPGSS